VDNPVELEAKVAFDASFAALAAQRTDLQQLQARAKDLIGFLTLAASFLAAFGKSNVEGVLSELSSGPASVRWLFIALPVVTLGACLYVLIPRSHWVFNVNAESVATAMDGRASDEGFSTPKDLYLWYVIELAGFQTKNIPPLQRRKYAVWCATAALAGSVMLIGYLVLNKG
jgi:hypothetical protein